MKPYISKQLSRCIILKMFELPAERPPLFSTSNNNYTIKYIFSDRENEYHITVDSNLPEYNYIFIFIIDYQLHH